MINPTDESILDKITLVTDVDRFSQNKKIQLFKEVNKEIGASKGTISKEIRFVIEKLCKSYESVIQVNNKLTKEIEELKSRKTEVNHSERESYANIVQNKKMEYPVIIESKIDQDGANLERMVVDKLKYDKKKIDFVKVRRRDKK